MARQKGPLLLKGTLGGMTYYRMQGVHLVRKKTSLDKERVLHDPAFAKSRKSSGLFGKAAKIASAVYWSLPAGKRKHGLIGKLTGKATRLLHAGKTERQVKTALLKAMK